MYCTCVNVIVYYVYVNINYTYKYVTNKDIRLIDIFFKQQWALMLCFCLTQSIYDIVRNVMINETPLTV